MYLTNKLKSLSIWNLPRFVGLLMLAAIALPGAVSLAQQSEAPEAMPVVSIHEFHTYDSKWIRYKNLDENGERKLELEAVTVFPFRYVVSEIPIYLVELKKLEDFAVIDELLNMLNSRQALIAKLFDEHETIAALIDDMTEELVDLRGEMAEDELVAALVAELVDRLIIKLIDEHELAYDEELIAGHCDTEYLRGKSPDLFCVPGTNAMPPGYIFLTLYLPESYEIVAMTASIDNIAGVAAKADWSRPAPQTAADRCGSYVPGQWIKAADYDASGLNLPVKPPELGGDITDYQCMVPQDGASYLQAYSNPGAPSSDSVVIDDDVDDDDDENDGGGPAVGSPELRQQNPESTQC